MTCQRGQEVWIAFYIRSRVGSYTNRYKSRCVRVRGKRGSGGASVSVVNSGLNLL